LRDASPSLPATLRPVRSTSTTRIAFEPGLLPTLRACAPRISQTSSTAFLADTMLTSPRRVRTRSAFAAQEPAPPWRPVKDAWVAEHYPDPSRARTPSVARSGSCRLERPAPPGARAPAPSSPGETTPLAEPSTPPIPTRTASRLPPRRGRRSAAPKVSSVPGNSLGRCQSSPGEPDSDHHPSGIGPLSTGCSQSVEKGPAPFSSCVMPCSDGAVACAGAKR
jgi:hypothetical protein